MLVKEIKAKFFEKIAINHDNQNDAQGVISKSRPKVDRDVYNIYQYKTALKVTFTDAEIAELFHFKYNLRINDIIEYINKLDPSLNISINTHQIYSLVQSFYVSKFDLSEGIYSNGLFIIETKKRELITKLTPTEKKLLNDKVKREDKMRIMDTFIIPYLNTALEKYGMELRTYHDCDPNYKKTIAVFSSEQTFKNFVVQALFEKINTDFKNNGIDLKLENILDKEKGVAWYSQFVSLYNCDLINDIANKEDD